MLAYSLFLSQYKYQANILWVGVKQSINNDDVIDSVDRSSERESRTLFHFFALHLLIYSHKTQLIMNASA